MRKETPLRLELKKKKKFKKNHNEEAADEAKPGQGKSDNEILA